MNDDGNNYLNLITTIQAIDKMNGQSNFSVGTVLKWYQKLLILQGENQDKNDLIEANNECSLQLLELSAIDKDINNMNVKDFLKYFKANYPKSYSVSEATVEMILEEGGLND